MICLVLPAAFYLKAVAVHSASNIPGDLEHFGVREGVAGAPPRGLRCLRVKQALAWFMLIIGVVLGISSLSLTIYYWDSFS